MLLCLSCATPRTGAPAMSLAGNVVLLTPERRLVAYDPSADRRTSLLPQLAGEVADAVAGPFGLVVLSCVKEEGSDRCRVARYDPSDDGLHPAAVLAEARDGLVRIDGSGSVQKTAGIGNVAGWL